MFETILYTFFSVFSLFVFYIYIIFLNILEDYDHVNNRFLLINFISISDFCNFYAVGISNKKKPGCKKKSKIFLIGR